MAASSGREVGLFGAGGPAKQKKGGEASFRVRWGTKSGEHSQSIWAISHEKGHLAAPLPFPEWDYLELLQDDFRAAVLRLTTTH